MQTHKFLLGLMFMVLSAAATVDGIRAGNENLILFTASSLGVAAIATRDAFSVSAWKNGDSIFAFSLILAIIMLAVSPSREMTAHAGMIVIAFAIVHRNAVELVDKTLTRNAVIARVLEAIVISITGSAAIKAITISQLSFAELLKVATIFLLTHLFISTFRR